jgi:transposase InsO family protein
MKERERLVQAYLTGRYSVTELAEMFDVSRKTIHKFIYRYRQLGPEGLSDRSHAATHHPNAIPPEIVTAVLRQKQAHPTWGPLKLSPGPQDDPETWPAASTRGLILARAGLTRTRKHRRRVPPTQPFADTQRPNDTWCADFKGWFRTGDGQRCDPFTVTDAYSRMLLCCRILDRPDHAHVRPVMERLFRENGLPQAIRTDNGPPFASTGAGGLSRLAVWWVKLGIHLERIRPGHPQQNGRHERMHLTLMEVCHPAAASAAAQQQRFEAFLPVFNHQRPHQALGLRPPSALYVPSARAYPSQLEDPVYPEAASIRRVRSNGEIRWQGKLIFLSEALIGEAVGVTEAIEGHVVSFGPICLGLLDPQKERLVQGIRSKLNPDL